MQIGREESLTITVSRERSASVHGFTNYLQFVRIWYYNGAAVEGIVLLFMCEATAVGEA